MLIQSEAGRYDTTTTPSTTYNPAAQYQYTSMAGQTGYSQTSSAYRLSEPAASVASAVSKGTVMQWGPLYCRHNPDMCTKFLISQDVALTRSKKQKVPTGL